MSFDHLKGDKPKGSANDWDNRPELHGIIRQEDFEFVNTINKCTVGKLGEEWEENVKRNKIIWRRNPKLNSLRGLGKNKCVIGIGAGPSFKKNQEVLKRIVWNDGVRPWEQRDFITIASNHQFKPLLEMGIIPDFVLLVDAGNDAVYDQLCRDIHLSGKNTTLLTGVHVLPKIAKNWTKQGRNIVMYTTNAPNVKKAFSKYISRNHEGIELGGNVLNGAWMIGLSVFNSTVFFGVGNDLSFELRDTIEEQRKSYYHDGDYTTNAAETGSGRDEAASEKKWAGYRLEKRRIIDPFAKDGCLKRYNVELDLVGTSYTLWVYKAWIESTIMAQTQNPVHFHYFNCTEGGIVGVMAKEVTDSALRDPNNWYLMDGVAINKHTGACMYHTCMLNDAAELFINTKRSYTWQEPQDAQYADGHSQRLN
ncbi:MAG: 6-hydroxymethylpterin diphosphokinase MptE-like protein [Candidatus Hodarchaeota archaeon]